MSRTSCESLKKRNERRAGKKRSVVIPTVGAVGHATVAGATTVTVTDGLTSVAEAEAATTTTTTTTMATTAITKESSNDGIIPHTEETENRTKTRNKIRIEVGTNYTLCIITGIKKKSSPSPPITR